MKRVDILFPIMSRCRCKIGIIRHPPSFGVNVLPELGRLNQRARPFRAHQSVVEGEGSYSLSLSLDLRASELLSNILQTQIVPISADWSPKDEDND